MSPKRVVYFQESGETRDSIKLSVANVPLIKSGDILAIQISSLNPEQSAIFNPYSMAVGTTTATTPTSTAGSLPAPVGYVVNQKGEITIPLLGAIKVVDLTVEEAGNLISVKLKRFLKEPTVDVRNLNFRISIMGEVNRPGLFTIPNNQVTLIEALSLAGDIPVTGRRDNVLIIRETNGEKHFARVNLTQRDLFRSPYYYLQANDIIYVEPVKARLASADRTFQLLPIVLSGFSILAIIVTRLI